VLKDDYFVPSGGRRKAGRLIESNAPRVLAILKSGAPAPASAAKRNFADVKAPTLMVLGDADDPEILQKANSIAAGIPHAKKVLVEGAGHTVHIEDGKKVLKMLMAFLEGREIK
jgi:pimeloyl-ACP methyl ester carboxylesterase